MICDSDIFHHDNITSHMEQEQGIQCHIHVSQSVSEQHLLYITGCSVHLYAGVTLGGQTGDITLLYQTD